MKLSEPNINSNDVEEILNKCEQQFWTSRLAGDAIVEIRKQLRELVSKQQEDDR